MPMMETVLSYLYIFKWWVVILFRHTFIDTESGKPIFRFHAFRAFASICIRIFWVYTRSLVCFGYILNADD